MDKHSKSIVNNKQNDNNNKNSSFTLKRRFYPLRKIARLASLDSNKTTDDSSLELVAGSNESSASIMNNNKRADGAVMPQQTNYNEQEVSPRRTSGHRAPLIRNPNHIELDNEDEEEKEEAEEEEEEYRRMQEMDQMQFRKELARYSRTPTIHRERSPQKQELPMSNREDLLDDREGMNEQQNINNNIYDNSSLSFDRSNGSSWWADPSSMGPAESPGSAGCGFKRARYATIGQATSGKHKISNSSSLLAPSFRNANNTNKPVSSFAQSKKSSFLGGRLRRATKRSKSPSTNSMQKRTHYRKRSKLFALASHLGLTQRHESIQKLQLSLFQSGLKFISPKRFDDPVFKTYLPKERMNAKEFVDRVKLIRRYPVLASIEYSFANKYELFACKHAQLKENQHKNTYKKCLPFDYNRVVLKTLPNKPHSDYINASKIDTYLKPDAYIAAMGPNEQTIEDFWRMVWEQKSFVIVMLTKVFDFIKVMCNQYWPVELNKPERYGNLEVTLLYEEPLADFVIRTIKLTKLPRQQEKQEPETKAAANDNEVGLDDYDQENEDETDLSEEIALNTEFSMSPSPQTADSTGNYSSKNIPRVRSPKFVSVRRNVGSNNRKASIHRSAEVLGDKSRRFLSPDSASESRRAGLSPTLEKKREKSPSKSENNYCILHQSANEANESTSGLLNKQQQFAQRPTNLNLNIGSTLGPNQEQQLLFQQQQQQQNYQNQLYPFGNQNVGQMYSSRDLLHPLFGLHATNGPFSRSSSPFQALSSAISLTQLSVPGTPMTPVTPSSAGGGEPTLDRSSATRRAVKKRRRVINKNTRPMMTEFRAPNESQLIDDDDDDILDGNGDDNLDQQNEDLLGGPGDDNKRSERIIYQFHYHNWAAHTVPDISSLLQFRRRVRMCMQEIAKTGRTGPTIVHCSDGCGRTGTYLSIDACLELAEEDGHYDVFNYTKKLRQSRKNLIETEDQYKFIYDTIEEAMFCGRTWFSVNELHQMLKFKSQRNASTKKNDYQLEYEKICRMTSKFSIGDCAGGHRVENREKNRDVSTVPPDNFRPYLTSYQSNDSTDYINAVFVDGYTRSKEYIVTEWPLQRTMSDFWSLVYDHDCNSVILLANPPESSTYPSFLPSEKQLTRKFNQVFSVEMVSYTHYQNIKSWIYTINKKILALTEVIAGVKSETKTTQVFQITCWPQGRGVPTSTNALVELMNMVERWRQRTAYGPVCVVSLNGKSRAGVYCAANVAIEQVVQHGEVDVFHAVKTVRRHRPKLIENATEYKYCYDLILHYVLYYLNQGTGNGP